MRAHNNFQPARDAGNLPENKQCSRNACQRCGRRELELVRAPLTNPCKSDPKYPPSYCSRSINGICSISCGRDQEAILRSCRATELLFVIPLPQLSTAGIYVRRISGLLGVEVCSESRISIYLICTYRCCDPFGSSSILIYAHEGLEVHSALSDSSWHP